MKTKNFITLMFIILFYNAIGQNNSLQPFEVNYLSGCNYIEKSKINIYFKDNKYFAEHILPIYFDGIKTDSFWTVELNEEKIKACDLFISKAKSLSKQKCENNTSVESQYVIKLEDDSIKINGCNWNSLGFEFLDSSLFYKNHLGLNNDKKRFINDLNKKLIGKWYFILNKSNLRKNDSLLLSRNKKSEYYVEFYINGTVKSNYLNALGIKDIKKYNIDISDSWKSTVFNFEGGKIIYNNKGKIMFSNNATFTLESINNEELKLIYLW